MPDIKTWLYEFIQEDDVDMNAIGTFVSIPQIDEEAKYDSMTARVEYKGERRRININKGNGQRLATAFGNNTDLWHQKQFRIRLPQTEEEKKSRMKLIIEPVTAAQKDHMGQLGKEERIALLKAKGVSDEQIKLMQEVGSL